MECAPPLLRRSTGLGYTLDFSLSPVGPEVDSIAVRPVLAVIAEVESSACESGAVLVSAELVEEQRGRAVGEERQGVGVLAEFKPECQMLEAWEGGEGGEGAIWLERGSVSDHLYENCTSRKVNVPTIHFDRDRSQEAQARGIAPVSASIRCRSGMHCHEARAASRTGHVCLQSGSARMGGRNCGVLDFRAEDEVSK